MRVKSVLVALVLLALFSVGSVFAEVLQCRDPADGTITVTFMGSTVRAVYKGFSAQDFEVLVLLKNGTTEVLPFSFAYSAGVRSPQIQNTKGGEIVRITRCDFTSYPTN